MIEKLTLPNQVVESDWKDDIGDYQTLGDEKQEMEYISPADVSKEGIKKIKAQKLYYKMRDSKFSLFGKDEKLVA